VLVTPHRATAGLLISAVAATLVAASPRLDPTPEWPGFRGPGMSGLAPAARVPDRWSKTSNVRWNVVVPGHGWSSPIVAGDTVFVTSAITDRPFKQPTPGIYGNDFIAEMRAQGLSSAEINKRLRARDNELPEESDVVRYMVYAFDARTGAMKWEREAHRGLPVGGRHRKNTYASETPFTDGERVYVSFGQNVGMFAFTVEGALVWKRTWPPQPIYLDFGTGSSPIAHDGRIYLLQDSERECFLTALDARTGDEIWRTPRKDRGSFQRTSSWSTPLVWRNSGRTEIVTTGHGFVMSYGLDGAELWRLNRTYMPLTSPVAAGDVLYAGTGAQEGDAARPVFAIKAGARGDITVPETGVPGEFVLWSHPRAAGYTPSAIVHDGRVYLVHDTGIMTVLRAATGTEIYRARVGGVGHTFSASPIATRDRIFFPDEDGVTVVLAPGDTYQEVALNNLEEMTLASPAVAGNALFIRTETRLYRVEANAAR
jgi:outer membrane protein assembly factor BamB